MKFTFLGSGSAFVLGNENYHSNILIEIGDDNLLFDAGTTIADALYYYGRKDVFDIKNIFLTHNHADHNGGLEYIGFKRYFGTFPFGLDKPKLFSSRIILDELWNECLKGGMKYVGAEPFLDTYFDVKPFTRYGDIENFMVGDAIFMPVPTDHCKCMPSYGLVVTHNFISVLITGDSKIFDAIDEEMYEDADIIFHDCEVKDYPNSVHAQYHELNALPPEIKAKMYLYHYTTDNGAIDLPDAVADGFRGFVERGKNFVF